MPRQVDRIRRTGLGENSLVEHPAQPVASESVDEENGDALRFALPDELDAAPASFQDLVSGARILACGLEIKVLEKILHVGVDVAVRNPCGRQHAEKRSDRDRLTVLDDDAPKRPGRGRLMAAGNLGGLDLDDLVARGNVVANIRLPRDNRALLHRQAPFGHQNWMNIAHRLLLGPNFVQPRARLRLRFSSACRPVPAPPPRCGPRSECRYPRGRARRARAHAAP